MNFTQKLDLLTNKLAQQIVDQSLTENLNIVDAASYLLDQGYSYELVNNALSLLGIEV